MSEPTYTFDGRAHDLGTISVRPVSPAIERLSAGAAVTVTAAAPARVAHAVTLTVPADEVPDVAARIARQMHEAAGLEPPLILMRPECKARYYDLGEVTARVGDDGLIYVTSGKEGLPYYKAVALAERLAYLAEVAEDSPSQAAVDALSSLVQDSDGTNDGIARLILAAGYRPPETGSQS